MRSAILPMVIISVLALLATGCGTASKAKDSQNRNALTLVRGRAKVLAVHADLGYADLRTEHGKRTAWWDTSVTIPRDVPANAPVQVVEKEPMRLDIAAPFQAGDTIEYSGQEINGEIHLSRVVVVKR